MVASLIALDYFMPIFSFLLVFVLVYALLAKTKVLGENKFVHLLLSFVLGIFFIVNASLVDFVQFSSAWFVVFFVIVFMIFVLISFTHGNLDDLMKPWVAWVMIGLIIGFLILASAYTFNWAVNWEMVEDWFYTDWFGFVLLLIIAGIAAWIVSRKVKE